MGNLLPVDAVDLSRAAAIDRLLYRRIHGLSGTAEPGGNGLDFDLVCDTTMDLPPPSAGVKSRMERLILLEHVERVVGWLVLTVVLIILGSFGGSMEGAAFWLCVGVLVVETMLKLTRMFVQDYVASGVRCSFVMLQFAEDSSRYHSYLAAVWFLRVSGILSQGVLAGTLAGRVTSQKALPIEDPSKDRLLETIHCCYGVVFLEVVISLFIVWLNSFHSTPFSLVLGLKRLVSSRAAPLCRSSTDTWTPDAVPESREAIRSLPRAIRESRAIEDLSALVWYLHCKQHPLLPAVCAYQTDGNCGLPGHWFLTVEQLLKRAFGPRSRYRKKSLFPDMQSNGVDMDQEMALDALARFAKSRDRHVCDLIVREDGTGIRELCKIVDGHRSAGCRERAVAVLSHLSQISRRERESGMADPYDPLRPLDHLQVSGLGFHMLNALVSSDSPHVRENAAAALFVLCERYRLQEVMFCGEQGKILFEEMATMTAGGKLTDAGCEYTFRVFGMVLHRHVPYAHSVRLEEVQSFTQLSAASQSPKIEWKTPRREVIFGVHHRHSCLKYEQSCILPPRGAFRESRALPLIVDFSVAPWGSQLCAFNLAHVFLCYHALGSHHLFPFEVAELTRLLHMRFERLPINMVYVLVAFCDLFLRYFSDDHLPLDGPDRRVEIQIDRDIVPRLITQERRRLVTNLVRFIDYLSSILPLEPSWQDFMTNIHQDDHDRFPILDGFIDHLSAIKPYEDSWRDFMTFIYHDHSRLPTLTRAYRSPARLLSYLLANHFDLLSDEIDEVFIETQSNSRPALLKGSKEHATMWWWLAYLIVEKEESRNTKLNACMALTRLATHRGNCLLPNAVKPWRSVLKFHSVHDCAILNEPAFQRLAGVLRNHLPGFGLEPHVVGIDSSKSVSQAGQRPGASSSREASADVQMLACGILSPND
ncbi:hypothetical protein CBR_g32562 [Chara braunii]|uniref:Uncharacterized protein n=1 Tax=Chara braunii TaxID=69332 RepID=A0A388LH41_CHABU|nr:hypothetical protein CBR_g32562 [Chara braunii]|eukprot:GBG81571.1 hypothetical protein CBR_g32562 [Chara braunii]